MSKTFTTVCPHCKQMIEVPYQEAVVQMARKSGAQRRGNSPYMKALIDRRWAKVKGEQTGEG